ncbi:GNAT family N-acetyltransferase [Butyrivibrio sp. NC3005]|uniref:GNAT family N-acetyltransferase n=1 Tax=Butyrivibrio sp. NC3005 TaxID=1280685 RepID=UPI0003F6BA3E|nr:GNAT family N-acetyltransferase [Butyrivibrio sp. NC3005]
MNVIIRKAVLKDYEEVEVLMEEVQNLHIELRPDVFRKTDVVLPKEEFVKNIEDEMIFVAEKDYEVVGALIFMIRSVASPHQINKKVLFIDTLVVGKKYQRQGIGTQLLDFAKERKSKLGLDSLELQVNARNVNALNMYKKSGFTQKSINMELLDK